MLNNNLLVFLRYYRGELIALVKQLKTTILSSKILKSLPSYKNASEDQKSFVDKMIEESIVKEAQSNGMGSSKVKHNSHYRSGEQE